MTFDFGPMGEITARYLRGELDVAAAARQLVPLYQRLLLESRGTGGAPFEVGSEDEMVPAIEAALGDASREQIDAKFQALFAEMVRMIVPDAEG